MKTSPVPQSLKAIVSLCICIGLLGAQPVLASGKPYKNYIITNPGIVVKDGLSKKEKNKLYYSRKSIYSRNNTSVKIFMDSFSKRVHIKSKENKGKDLDFFVFDLEGTLVHNHKMKTKDHYRISNLTKGMYVYRVFCGDEETATGQFEIK